jgi:hypothetical protein
MKLEPMDLDAFQASLPEPFRVHLAEARGALFGVAREPCRVDSDDEEPDFWLDDDWVSESVDSFIARIGRNLLSSDSFWTQYEVARQQGLEIPEALSLAAKGADTPRAGE